MTMCKTLAAVSAVAVAAALTAGSAEAARFVLEDSGAGGGLLAGSIPGGQPNAILGPSGLNVSGGNAQGWYGGALGVDLEGDASAEITFDFIGFEAGFVNSFEIGDGGTPEFDTSGGSTPAPDGNGGRFAFGNPLETALLSGVLDGLLNFEFSIDSGATTLENGVGENTNTAGTPNFFISFDFNTANVDEGGVAWLFLDDAGAGPDDNHDDLVVRATIRGEPQEMPEPATLAMVGLGLAGIGIAGRRRLKR
jgi:hypothetical protein